MTRLVSLKFLVPKKGGPVISRVKKLLQVGVNFHPSEFPICLKGHFSKGLPTTRSMKVTF